MEIDFELDSLLVKLNHHKFDKEINEFNPNVEAVTSFKL